MYRMVVFSVFLLGRTGVETDQTKLLCKSVMRFYPYLHVPRTV